MPISPCHNVMVFQLPLDCAAILAAADASGWRPGTIRGATGATEELAGVRRCRVSDGVPHELLRDLATSLVQVGRGVYGFDIDGLDATDPALVMRYEIGDHFRWHVDNGDGAPPFGTRKLSFTLQLSDGADYDGGDLELATYAPAFNPEAAPPGPEVRARGTLVLFPSHMLHRVTPVTRGVRLSLVGWLHGPPFR